jgi:signal transduction histidine kinase
MSQLPITIPLQFHLLIQSDSAELRGLLRADALYLALGGLLLLGALVSLTFWTGARHRRASLLWLGVFALLYGFRLLARTTTFRLCFDVDPSLWDYADAAITYVIPLPIILLARTLAPGWRRFWTLGAVVMVAFATYAIASDLVLRTPESASTPSTVITIAFFAGLLVWLFRPGSAPSRERRTLRVGGFVVSATALADNLRSVDVVDFPGPELEPFGFAVLVGCLGTVAARRILDDARRIVALEVANAELKERQAEMLFEGKMAALSGLVAGVAHELNTPLAVIRSGLDITEKATVKATQGGATEALSSITRESAETARIAVARIANLVDALRDFARLDEAEEKYADLRDGLESTLALIDPTKLGETRVVKDFSEIPPVRCRPKELNQVFMTLIVNALDAMRGSGELTIATSVSDATLSVTVADTGPGIPESVLTNLFELQFRPGRGRMTMGLGLPTARRIVERHGGVLNVQSQVGIGTSFTVTLPLGRG